MSVIRKIASHTVFKTAMGKKLLFCRELYFQYSRKHKISFKAFLLGNFKKVYIQKQCKQKHKEVVRLIDKLDIAPISNATFFYSIDCFKKLKHKQKMFDNYTIDYYLAVDYSLTEFVSRSSEYSTHWKDIIGALYRYVIRAQKKQAIALQYEKAFIAIRSLFERKANSFFEALQRILFVNQFLWQTNHGLNGLGRLDKILYPLYKKDIAQGVLTREKAKALLAEFFSVLHHYYWFKSSELLGDTGQIIILGGLNQDGQYECNDLTRMFIEISMEMKLPDPKVFLRCASNMPDDLLSIGLDCIATGIGAPFLSNDEAVVPRLIEFGYAKEDAYNYVTSACWEPLIAGKSCDQNNIEVFNFAKPFIKLFECEDLEGYHSFESIVTLYKQYLKEYVHETLTPLESLSFEEDPLLTLFCPSALEKGKDILHGGAEYANMGLTSVAIGSVVNSLLNIKKHVFDERKYSLNDLNNVRKGNYVGYDELRSSLKNLYPCYGSDDESVIALVNTITDCVSKEFEKYSTKQGGKFKFGLSSPGYFWCGKETPATFDGRKDGEPFATHISCDLALPTTELMQFGMKLDYRENRFNGNVLDFFVTPDFLKKNQEKYKQLLRASFSNGLYQLQMNVVDSKTLIAAKENPELFPNLVVRVWGFSAYFNDLPEEYKELLINRALESENAV